jgi:hypothetical protein
MIAKAVEGGEAFKLEYKVQPSCSSALQLHLEQMEMVFQELQDRNGGLGEAFTVASEIASLRQT